MLSTSNCFLLGRLWRTLAIFVLKLPGFGFIRRLIGRQSCASCPSLPVDNPPQACQVRIEEARKQRFNELGFPRFTEDQNIDRIKEFVGSVNEDAVCALASRFNGNTPCRVVSKSYGSFNLCFFVEFNKQDGAEQPRKWVVRLPMGPAVDNPWDKVVNEVTTMRYIQKKTSIPVPRIHTYGRDATLILKSKDSSNSNIQDDQVYIITDFVAGTSLNKKLLSTANQTLRWGFYSQLVDILVELRKLEFPKIGSLIPDKDKEATPVLGSILSMSDNTLRMAPPPALTSATNYIAYAFNVVSEFFFAPVGDMTIKDLRKELYALHALELQLRGLIDPALGHGPFILHHLDLRAHNILVDEQLRIQSVIDWEFTSTVPLPLFTPPSWVTGHDAKETGSVLHAEFRKVLHAQAKENPSCRQLEREWYGEVADDIDETDTAVSSETVKRFCIAHILRQPADAVDIFYGFMDNMNDDTEEEARLARLFNDHPELEAEAQRRCAQSRAYSQYLADNGLFETRMDRFRHLEKQMKAKFGWE